MPKQVHQLDNIRVLRRGFAKFVCKSIADISKTRETIAVGAIRTEIKFHYKYIFL